MSVTVLQGDCRSVLPTLAAGSVHCCVTSPPYFGLRDYGVAGQIGLEANTDAWLAEMVAVFGAVRRVLRDDGTLWVNIGDAYAGSGRGGNPTRDSSTLQGSKKSQKASMVNRGAITDTAGLKAKDLIGLPWRLAFALQADGWYLRSDVIWHKPNPMPESVTDRPTKAHEYLFLLSKGPRYYYDAAAIYEPVTGNAHARAPKVSHWMEGEGSHAVIRNNGVHPKAQAIEAGNHKGPRPKQNSSFSAAVASTRTGKMMPPIGGKKHAGNNGNPTYSGEAREAREARNARTVWTIPTEAYKGAHYATFPRELVRRPILAGCPVGGTVLDPFGGTGTTAEVAVKTGRRAVLVELNPEYVAQIRQRLESVALFAGGAA